MKLDFLSFFFPGSDVAEQSVDRRAEKHRENVFPAIYWIWCVFECPRRSIYRIKNVFKIYLCLRLLPPPARLKQKAKKVSGARVERETKGTNENIGKRVHFSNFSHSTREAKLAGEARRHFLVEENEEKSPTSWLVLTLCCALYLGYAIP